MKDTEQELDERMRAVLAHESRAVFTVFIALLSTLVGSFLALTSLFDMSAISRVFEKFGSLSDVLKITVGILFGALIAMLVHRSLGSKIQMRLKREALKMEVDKKLKVKE